MMEIGDVRLGLKALPNQASIAVSIAQTASFAGAIRLQVN